MARSGGTSSVYGVRPDPHKNARSAFVEQRSRRESSFRTLLPEVIERSPAVTETRCVADGARDV